MMENEEQELECDDKLAFDTQKEALAAAAFAKWQYGSSLKVYKCRHCGLWHLTTS